MEQGVEWIYRSGQGGIHMREGIAEQTGIEVEWGYIMEGFKSVSTVSSCVLFFPR